MDPQFLWFFVFGLLVTTTVAWHLARYWLKNADPEKRQALYNRYGMLLLIALAIAGILLVGIGSVAIWSLASS